MPMISEEKAVNLLNGRIIKLEAELAEMTKLRDIAAAQAEDRMDAYIELEKLKTENADLQHKLHAEQERYRSRLAAYDRVNAELKQAQLDAKGIRELWQSAEAENAELRKTIEQKHEINCQLTEERDKFAAELAELRKALAEERMDDDSRWQLLGKIAKLEIELDKHRGIKVEAPRRR